MEMNPNSTTMVHSREEEEDESWEVKAFAQDTGNVWPPRSYTCTFCRREFRSAQALGGHMNVHRRDRARLHQAQNFKNPNLSSSTHGGLCYLFSLPNPNAVFKPTSSPNYSSNLMNFPAVVAPPPPPHSFSYALSSYSSNNEASRSIDRKRQNRKNEKTDLVVEGIDLELRLGCSSSSGS